MDYAALHWPQIDWSAERNASSATEDDRPTWSYPWPAGERLGRDLLELVSPAGQRVCDLGCGRGHLGLRAACAGAEVTCADASQSALNYVASVAAVNQLTVTTVLHRWGAPIPGAPFDLIIGGDILYRPECHTELLTSIALSLADEGTCLLSDPRTCLEAALPQAAAGMGLEWREERREDFTLARVRRCRTDAGRAGPHH